MPQAIPTIPLSTTGNTVTSYPTSYKIRSLKIDKLNVNVRSSFYPDKSLYDALYTIASTRLKENPV